MKISPDQNTITLDDGSKFNFFEIPTRKNFNKCADCHLRVMPVNFCDIHRPPCFQCDRADGKYGIFIKESKND